MSNLKPGIILSENENLVMELEAELWATSSNPIARFFGFLRKIVSLIFGIKHEGYLVLTDKRVVEVRNSKACWVLNTSKDIKYVMPSSVKEVGYAKEGTFCGCFCHAYHLYYDAATQRTSIQLKGMDEKETLNLVNTFYRTITSLQ